MKKTTGFLLAMMLMLSIMLGTPIAASVAINKTQDGFSVTIATDKESYATNEDINLSITVENTNAYPVENVSIEALLPEGLKLKSGTLTKETATLEAGDTLTVSIVALSWNNPDNISSSPKTGDTSNILLWVILLYLSAVVCVVTFKHRKKSAKILSVFLCLVLLGTIAPMGIFSAEETKKSIDTSKTISVDNKNYDIKAIVSYTPNGTEPNMEPCTHSPHYGFNNNTMTLDGVYETNRIEDFIQDISIYSDNHNAVVFNNGVELQEGFFEEGMTVKVYQGSQLCGGEYTIKKLLYSDSVPTKGGYAFGYPKESVLKISDNILISTLINDQYLNEYGLRAVVTKDGIEITEGYFEDDMIVKIIERDGNVREFSVQTHTRQ